ncbi:hypothetical protein ABZ912_28100 [Nonomuraea angiospora]|uniref:hypothetical protein n=1 Tax=Nonomuraea angiospora TaxID=46172 RepID=UPI0033F480A7
MRTRSCAPSHAVRTWHRLTPKRCWGGTKHHPTAGGEGLPPGRYRLASPHDLDTHWAAKGSELLWNGYKVHIAIQARRPVGEAQSHLPPTYDDRLAAAARWSTVLGAHRVTAFTAARTHASDEAVEQAWIDAYLRPEVALDLA